MKKPREKDSRDTLWTQREGDRESEDAEDWNDFPFLTPALREL